MKKLFKILLLIVVVIIAALVVTVFMYRNFLSKPISADKSEVYFEVKKGYTSNRIISELYNEGLIKNQFFAKIYVKRNKLDTKLKVGIYKFTKDMTPNDIFSLLLKGAVDPDVINVTIPEGYTVKQIAETLFNEGIIKSKEEFIKEANEGTFDFDFIKDIPKDRPSRLEGYLFPATYELKKNTPSHDVINKMLQAFYTIKGKSIDGKIKNGMTMDKVIILASIVEKEAVLDSERSTVAAVFLNRLKINQKLESCATIEYALGIHKDIYSFKDLEVDSPYNTYKYAGLPKGPISNPGEKSIEAVINPDNVDYLYFAAKGDGSQYFTKDYNDFLRFKKTMKK